MGKDSSPDETDYAPHIRRRRIWSATPVPMTRLPLGSQPSRSCWRRTTPTMPRRIAPAVCVLVPNAALTIACIVGTTGFRGHNVTVAGVAQSMEHFFIIMAGVEGSSSFNKMYSLALAERLRMFWKNPSFGRCFAMPLQKQSNAAGSMLFQSVVAILRPKALSIRWFCVGLSEEQYVRNGMVPRRVLQLRQAMMMLRAQSVPPNNTGTR